MDCCLLFHDTSFFAKILKIVNLDVPGSMWSFLKASRERSEALPRSALADRVAHDPSLLAFLGSMLFSAAELSPENSLKPTCQAWQARVSWYAATVAAAVDVRAPSEDFLRALLPQLVKGTALKAAPSVQAGSYIVAIKLAMSQVLSQDASELLLTVVTKTHAPQFASHAFACAFALSAGLEALPSDTVNTFLKMTPLPIDSLAVAAERFDGAHFMHLLLLALLHRLPADPTPIAEAICELIRVELPVGTVIQKVVPQAILFAAEEAASQKAAAVALLTKCASSYPGETDEAVRGALGQLQGGAKAAALAALTQTPSMRLQPAGDLGTTIWLALEHSEAEVRSKAVVHVLDLDDDASEDLAPALLRRLDDSSPRVVASLSTHAKAPALLVRCCADPSERLGLLEKALRTWNQEWIRDPEVSAPALSGLLTLLVTMPDLEATAVATMLIGYFPCNGGVHRATKLSSGAQNATAMVWASALTSAASLFKSSGLALFKRLAAPPSKGLKKGQFEKTCMEWAATASEALASGLFGKSSASSSPLLEVETWVTLRPMTQAKLLEAVAVAARGKNGQEGAAYECAMQLLRQTLPSLSEASYDLKSAALDLCVAIVPREATRSKAWSGDLLLAHLLELAPAVFAEPSAQEALQQMLALHVDRSSPLPCLASVFASSLETMTNVAPVRALSVASTFVSALTSGGANIPQPAQERALHDAAFIFPHLLVVLQHPDKVARQAGIGVLTAIDGCNNSAALKKMQAKVPLAPGNPVKDAITVSGADLFKLCGSLVSREAELLMDPNALSSCLADLFLQDSPDRAWKKARSPCLNFLIAHAANLTFTPGSQHVGASVLAILGRGDLSVLKSHVKVAWPCCEGAATDALSRASNDRSKLTWAIEVLQVCASSFVFTGSPVPAAPFALVIAMLNAVAAGGKDPSPSLRVIAKHVLRSTTKGFSAQLDQPQVEALFVAILAAGRALPSKSAMMRSALLHLSPSPSSLSQVVKSAASAKSADDWLPAASFTLIALDLPLANFVASTVTLDPLLPLLDEVNSLLVQCHQAAGASDEEVAFCQGLACNLASQLLNASVSSSKPFKKLHSRASAYADTLRTCMESRKQPVRVTSAATQFLAALASRCPQEMTSSIVGMVRQLSLVAAADRHDDSLFDCTQQVLRSVLPHLRESGGSVGLLLRDLVLAFQDGAGSRRLAICATLLQVRILVLSYGLACRLGCVLYFSLLFKCNVYFIVVFVMSLLCLLALILPSHIRCQGLSSAVLPALVLMVDSQLGHAIAARCSPVDQIKCTVQLLETAQACLAWSRGGEAPHLALGSGGMTMDLSLLNKSGASVALLCSDFVADHLASRQFHFQLLRLGKGDEKETQTMFLHLCQQLLACMRHDDTTAAAAAPTSSKKRRGASGALPATAEDPKALSSVMSALNRALSNLQGLLSVSGFVAVVQELFDDDDESHRGRGLELLPHRIEGMQRDGGVSSEEAALFVDMTNDLTAGLESHKDKATALCALELLARAFAAKHPTPFGEALIAVTSLLESGTLHSDLALSAALLCTATLCSSLGTKAFPSLPRLMPIALRELSDPRGEDRQRPALAMLVAFANSLAQFMHPYLDSLLAKGAALATSSDAAVRHLSGILFARLAATVGLRLALPLVGAALEAASGGQGAGNQEQAVWVLGFFQQLVGAAAQKDLIAHLPDLSSLLLEALKWEAVHEAAVGALVAVVLRMNEHHLSAFFLQLMAWKDSTLSSRLTFFRVTEVLAERLKSIFVPFFEYFFDDCRAELAAVFSSSSSDKASASGSNKKKRHRSESSRDSEGSDAARGARFFASLPEDDQRLHLSLLQAVVGSLRLCFKYDTPSDGFMNRERVSAVAELLVCHLALAAHDASYAAGAIAPCVAQLAAVAGVAEAWKTLNYSVLLQTREEHSAVRLAALETLHACFSTVGEEYLVMLPESLSFLSELLEDKDTKVEAKCRSVLKSVEELSGESLDSYL